MSEHLSERERLLLWYSRLHPPVVDIVGDFAGRELFLIHGESLLRHCLVESRVDFEEGFQLLHAVYAVEVFLSNLAKRGCNFDIAFFRDKSSLCSPDDSSDPNRYKYELARAIIIRHLAKATQTSTLPGTADERNSLVVEFESEKDLDFVEYMRTHTLQFFMCHEGEDASDNQKVLMRHFIHNFVSRGRNVAILNSVECKSSKVFARLISGTSPSITSLSCDLPPSDYKVSEAAELSSYKVEGNVCLRPTPCVSSKSMRLVLSIEVCCAMRQSATAKNLPEVDRHIRTYCLHQAFLEHCSLAERPCPGPAAPDSTADGDSAAFIRELSEVVFLILRDTPHILDLENFNWDLYDLLDGRLFLASQEKLRRGHPIPGIIVRSAEEMIRVVTEKTWNSIPVEASQSTTEGLEPTAVPSVMAFSHPVMDQFLAEIKLEQSSEMADPRSNVIFEDLTHWHNTKRIADDRKPKKLDGRALKRSQQKQRDMVAYSASLTNSHGKVLEPETIIVKRSGAASRKPIVVSGKASGNSNKKAQQAGKNAKGPGGVQAALEAAKAVQSQKSQVKDDSMVRNWHDRCAEMEKETNLVRRYLKAQHFALEQSTKTSCTALGSETSLYLCHIIGKIWQEVRTGLPESDNRGLYLVALIWNHLQQCSKATCNTKVIEHIHKLRKFLPLPQIHMYPDSKPRQLPFNFDFKALETGQNSFPDCRALQLEYGGPYMDRQFDPQPDPRVRFAPDGWQRRVLDSIDADRSLLVVAPTSAGKTFISFYAMKQVLEQSDDGVLVYVAPTKALVNQIAAEIDARFSKRYEGSGAKSVWAIHTRDYRIHTPTSCQILVTVPSILQIMLLAPQNAIGNNAWSRRVKRIIFDEVHSIGQFEDGVIWEQLLLQAPCPIIALSATIANSHEFRDWLALSQSMKGYEVDMVVHNVRYSELRKFHYEPPKESLRFTGLDKLQRVPVPGLDEGSSLCKNLKFIHPVVSISDHNVKALGDLSFEARDCFSMWSALEKTCSAETLQQLGVEAPEKCLPEAISKSDVVKWEAKLKDAVSLGLNEGLLDLQKLRRHLENEAPGSTAENHMKSLFGLACDLHSQDALPALIFNYDRVECEQAGREILEKLVEAETTWKDSSSAWKTKLSDFEKWKVAKSKISASKASSAKKAKSKKARGDRDNEERTSKLETEMVAASIEASPWESFDPDAPLEEFSFADHSKAQRSEVNEMLDNLHWVNLDTWLTDALLRGIGIHHAGMNLRYRQVVEMLFRRGFLRLVIATGTLALGINMPCKTVVFSGDSVWLTAQNYRQCSGRAGRRGFDLLGNVVFNGIPIHRVYEIMSSRLPDLRGQFPLSTTLILRLFGLLHGTDNGSYAVDVVNSLISQTRVYLGGPESKDSIKHHLRFSIEYLRRQHLLSDKGIPLNFSGLVGHLYFTESSVFAFHSLIKGGYFHGLCSHIHRDREGTFRKMVLVLSHLFNRVPVTNSDKLPSIGLPRLPNLAEELLIEHNAETLSIFEGYVRSYVCHNLKGRCDRKLPFSEIEVGREKSELGNPLGSPPILMRSAFVALSGFDDNFRTIRELCSTVRGDVFLEESAIPYIPIWPYDSPHRFNSYIYDFFKHGSMKDLVRHNQIKGGDVWFHLKDFYLTLAAIVSSLEGLKQGQSMLDEEGDGVDGMQDIGENMSEAIQLQRESSHPGPKPANNLKVKEKKEVAESWDDMSSDSDSVDETERTQNESARCTSTTWDDDDTDSGSWEHQHGSLDGVLEAFTLLRDEFDQRFRKVWA